MRDNYMIESGDPKIDRILKKLTDTEVETLTKYLTRKILSILVNKIPVDHHPLKIQGMN